MDERAKYEVENLQAKQKIEELEIALQQHISSGWQGRFDERQRRLIANCRSYTASDPAGMPGHNLAIIIAEMADMLDIHVPDAAVNKYSDD